MNKKLSKYLIIGGAAILLALILNPFYVVGATKRGLVVEFGKVSDTVVPSGLHLRIPVVQTIEKISIAPRQMETKIPVGTEGAITRDNQTVGVTVTSFYKYREDQLPHLYRDITLSQMDAMVERAKIEAVKSTIGTYDIFSLAEKTEELSGKIIDLWRTKLAGQPVELVALNLTNWDWDDKFDEQIRLTMEKAQQVKQSAQDLEKSKNDYQKDVEKAKAEAEKTVATAEADKKAVIAKAEGEKQRTALEAEAKVLEGEGIRKYNASVASNLEIELQLRRLEIEKIKAGRWNGEYVPNNMYGPIPVDTKGGILGK